MHPSSTIAAIATAPVSAALGIVRISGDQAAAIIDMVVPDAKASEKPRRMLASMAINPDTGEAIDHVICFFAKGKRTSTGEDIAEIHGHGGTFIMQRLLEASLAAGAVPADPGEFTYRAFKNGRMDLTQAEAIMGLIGARSERAARVALRQLEGTWGHTLEKQFEALGAISAQVEAGLDFPDEDLPIEQSRTLADGLREVAGHLTRLRDSFNLGNRLTEGAKVAIVGPPNAGKSSILNKLVGEERALVDHDPGTTRDIVEAQGQAAGIPLVFVDTAGLREKAGRVEKQGIKKAVDTAGTADLLLIVLDGTQAKKQFDVINNLVTDCPNTIIALNKSDLKKWNDDLKHCAFPKIPVSALIGNGVEELTNKIGQLLEGDADSQEPVLTTARQHHVVSATLEHVEKAIQALDTGIDPELAAVDLRWAREGLAALWGRSATDDMLDAIFSSFCLGK